MARILCGRPQRIDPPETLEAREVPVRAAEGEPMLDGERSEVRVRYEVGLRLRLEERGERGGVPIRRLRDPRRREVEPARDDGQAVVKRQWPRDYRTAGRQPHEREQRSPGEADALWAVQAVIEP
jgi:hypothetical protein